jgi:hypothetical protein
MKRVEEDGATDPVIFHQAVRCPSLMPMWCARGIAGAATSGATSRIERSLAMAQAEPVTDPSPRGNCLYDIA